MKIRQIGYWVSTGIVALLMGSGGILQLMRRPDAVAGIVQLGYPAYFVILLGAWKVLGALVVLAPRLPRLKEWAYAGVIFDLTAASVSHAASGSGAGNVVAPSLFALIALASWALRPEGRRLGRLLDVKPEREVSSSRPALAR